MQVVKVRQNKSLWEVFWIPLGARKGMPKIASNPFPYIRLKEGDYYEPFVSLRNGRSRLGLYLRRLAQSSLRSLRSFRWRSRGWRRSRASIWTKFLSSASRWTSVRRKTNTFSEPRTTVSREPSWPKITPVRRESRFMYILLVDNFWFSLYRMVKKAGFGQLNVDEICDVLFLNAL